jgi:hypothetical protein
MLDDRADQTIRQLRPNDRKKIVQTLQMLGFQTPEDLVRLPSLFKIRGTDLFVFRATPRLRVLFHLEPERMLVVEDIVSREVLQKHFRKEGR